MYKFRVEIGVNLWRDEAESVRGRRIGVLRVADAE